MPDVITPFQRHRNMAAIHSSSTKPELKLRHSLWHLGFRYRVNDKRLPGSPDIVLPKYRTVIFIHGCFWHGHKGCKNYTVPKTNTDFWTAKITRNQQRDQEVWRQLEAKGWYVIIVWECQLKKAFYEETVSRVRDEILQNAEKLRMDMEERRRIKEAYHHIREEIKKKEAESLEELGSPSGQWTMTPLSYSTR